MLKKRSMLAVALILLPVLLSLFAGRVGAQPPLPIGDPGYTQANPFDSKPTAGVYSNVGAVSGTFPDNAEDGDLSSNVNWIYGGGDPATPPSYVEVSAFKKPSDNGLTDFAIQWIDIKVSYKAASTSANDDQYRFVAYVNPSATEVVLADWVTGDAATYDPGLGLQGHRTFSNIAEPNNGVWTWTDLTNLRVRVDCLRVGTNGMQRIYLYEVWVTAYSTPYPASGTTSVQPSTVTGLPPDMLFYIDIYVTDVTQLWGYEINIFFDPAVLMGLEFFSYGPFVSLLPSEIGSDYVAVAGKTYDGDPTGFTGSTPVCRIYFYILAEGDSALTFTKADLANVYGVAIPTTPVDGYFSTGAPPTTGTISGTVKDASTSNAISGASVEATGPQTKGTTTFSDGTYTISDLTPGSYSVTASKTGYKDQTKPATVTAGQTTTIDFALVPRAHDIAVTNVQASETKVIPGDPVTIIVAVENQGECVETFTVTVFYDDTVAAPPQTVADLASGASANLEFTWDTTSVPVGNYTIKAQASTVPGEVDTEDNTRVDGIVTLAACAQALEELIETIETWNLPKGTEKSLTSKLEGALHLLDTGNENGAIHKLMDFIHQVEALRGTKLTNKQADFLVFKAQRIIDLIEE